MRENKKRGFTLIEMLVVTALAAMILSGVFISITNAKKKNRDARREQDIKQIQNALNIYATNRGLYPKCANEIVVDGSEDCLSQELIDKGSFSGKLPTDPLRKSAGECGIPDNYVYCYQSADGFSYTIYYALEGDSIQGKSAGWQTVNISY